MSNTPEPSIRVKVDLTNPGQFFACCGLLELADRLWPGAEGWFKNDEFCITTAGTLVDLLDKITSAELNPINPDDSKASPIHLSNPFIITLDWWADESSGGKQFKTWAGSMDCVRIARAMQRGIRQTQRDEYLFNEGMVVHDPAQPNKKVEPYYFDARRGQNAHALDVGFSPDELSMATIAYPAVEFLCLVGLQRCRPAPINERRQFKYFAWTHPLPIIIVQAVMNGTLPIPNTAAYQIEVAFRSEQKKHKSFLSATPI